MYKLIRNPMTGVVDVVNKSDDNGVLLSIPFAEDNTDYQQFLRWCEEGNQPLPAEE